MANKEKHKVTIKDLMKAKGGYQPEPLIGDHEQIIPPKTGSNVRVPKKSEACAGYINVCTTCGVKFVDSELRVFPLCPKCTESAKKNHNDSLLPQLEAQRYASNQNFIKKDSGKLQWSLMPFEELKDVVKVLMHGAEKYSPDNWKKCDNVVRYKDALMRHVIAYVSGEEIDSEFGLSHLAHAVCNCLFLMWFDRHKDDKASE
jgi:hypothetical protein